MLNARTFLVPICWAVLSAAPLICAQDVETSDARSIRERPASIQELELQSERFLSYPLQVDTAWMSSIEGKDLSRYRRFQLGMNVLAVAKQADVEPSVARLIHQRPAVIQELEWRPQGSLPFSPQADAVSGVLFSFYNGELFRMVVN